MCFHMSAHAWEVDCFLLQGHPNRHPEHRHTKFITTVIVLSRPFTEISFFEQRTYFFPDRQLNFASIYFTLVCLFCSENSLYHPYPLRSVGPSCPFLAYLSQNILESLLPTKKCINNNYTWMWFELRWKEPLKLLLNFLAEVKYWRNLCPLIPCFLSSKITNWLHIILPKILSISKLYVYFQLCGVEHFIYIF